ncbi:hypothetical protein BJ138DRAFT_788849 [Hygrophoropsis aurantiaca]|uniref:Uncharacterized protein n=1 Tax=Hygrophoropsis aurantiaca TaxID=72124 RepID=A0ACB8AHL1_9AGAM|nr:hypothetical protein BJ138DRAFT_788849 [Hygrophoropsis aurantiaca]
MAPLANCLTSSALSESLLTKVRPDMHDDFNTKAQSLGNTNELFRKRQLLWFSFFHPVTSDRSKSKPRSAKHPRYHIDIPCSEFLVNDGQHMLYTRRLMRGHTMMVVSAQHPNPHLARVDTNSPVCSALPPISEGTSQASIDTRYPRSFQGSVFQASSPMKLEIRTQSQYLLMPSLIIRFRGCSRKIALCSMVPRVPASARPRVTRVILDSVNIAECMTFKSCAFRFAHARCVFRLRCQVPPLQCALKAVSQSTVSKEGQTALASVWVGQNLPIRI